VTGVHERWGITSTILSPSPATIDVLATVFDEVIGALGNVPYFHLGGDECVFDQWIESDEITAYQQSLGLDAPSDLHAWFLRTLADLLANRGCRAVVWDEAFVSGELRADTIVMAWRQMSVARRAAAAGHDIVTMPVFPTYFDYAESSSDDEPVALGEATTLSDVIAFDPAPASWSVEERAHVLGPQFALWSELLPNSRALDYRAWPRGCALAEVAWSDGHDDFDARLQNHLGRLDALGVEYRPLAGPHPWQRGGTGPRRRSPHTFAMDQVVEHLDQQTQSADSTRPSG
jgi:hexosaminidase